MVCMFVCISALAHSVYLYKIEADLFVLSIEVAGLGKCPTYEGVLY